MQPDQQRRYIRQIMLPEIGEAGQQKLFAARVLVIGAGGLGSPLMTYLASSGIGHLGVIDDDRVERSNLPRQTLFEEGDIGRLKVEAASDRLSELNAECTLTTYPFALTAENAPSIIAAYDIVADGCDNFTTRFAVNDACRALNKPLVSAAISGLEGQVMSITRDTPCYRCFIHPEAPDANTCRESGVLAPVAGVIGTMQALEVVRMILGFPALVGKLAVFDGSSHQQRIVHLAYDSDCPVCGSIDRPRQAVL